MGDREVVATAMMSWHIMEASCVTMVPSARAGQGTTGLGGDGARRSWSQCDVGLAARGVDDADYSREVGSFRLAEGWGTTGEAARQPTPAGKVGRGGRVVPGAEPEVPCVSSPRRQKCRARAFRFEGSSINQCGWKSLKTVAYAFRSPCVPGVCPAGKRVLA